MPRPAPVLIRPYRGGDRGQVMDLAPRLSEGVAAWRDPEAVGRAVRGWVAGSLETAAEPGHAVFVAEADGEIAGVVTVTEKAHFTGQVDAYVGELVVAAAISEPARSLCAALGFLGEDVRLAKPLAGS
jgi:hypothetical protein